MSGVQLSTFMPAVTGAAGFAAGRALGKLLPDVAKVAAMSTLAATSGTQVQLVRGNAELALTTGQAGLVAGIVSRLGADGPAVARSAEAAVKAAT